MSAQNSYGYATPCGVAGGIYDLSPYAIDARLNGEEKAGVLKLGMGVIQGETPGNNIVVPDSTATADKFEGIVVNGNTVEQDMDGNAVLKPKTTVGVMRYGKVWGRVTSTAVPVYGANVYLTVEGEEAGCFTEAADGAIAINARFIGSKGCGNIAPIELFNQMPVMAAAGSSETEDVNQGGNNNEI